jgi:hypothetical protein
LHDRRSFIFTGLTLLLIGRPVDWRNALRGAVDNPFNLIVSFTIGTTWLIEIGEKVPAPPGGLPNASEIL